MWLAGACAALILHGIACASVGVRFAGVATTESFEKSKGRPLEIQVLGVVPTHDAAVSQPVQRDYPNFVPSLDDRGTVTALALMSSTAYSRLDEPEGAVLVDVRDTDHFGWGAPGVRGHVFASDDGRLAIVAFKGTSLLPQLDADGGTVNADKRADNTMFSCCCAHVDRTWSPVCDCFRGPGECSRTCVEAAVRTEKDSYYAQALRAFDQVVAAFPQAQTIWLTGHSLGGALASLVAATHPSKAFAVTFASPGALRYARILGLDLGRDPALLPVRNYGHTADPIFTGRCAGIASGCYLAGYAMETTCRMGTDCVFDVGSQWGRELASHRISWIIRRVLLDDAQKLPQCTATRDCLDCPSWHWVS